jgi:hypothetical protein
MILVGNIVKSLAFPDNKKTSISHQKKASPITNVETNALFCQRYGLHSQGAFLKLEGTSYAFVTSFAEP